jgi:hypothetical protein
MVVFVLYLASGIISHANCVCRHIQFDQLPNDAIVPVILRVIRTQYRTAPSQILPSSFIPFHIVEEL